MSDLISRRMMLDKMISRKRLFSTNQYEYMALSEVDKARADEIDNCIADLRNAPDAELKGNKMDKALFMETMMDMFDKMSKSDMDYFKTKIKITETQKPEYTTKALDFLYNTEYGSSHEELFSAIVHAELGKYRFYQYQWERQEGLYVRETIANVCDLLDKGMTLRDIAKELNLHFDTVCRIRAFFEEKH